jgi:hypothetical protein
LTHQQQPPEFEDNWQILQKTASILGQNGGTSPNFGAFAGSVTLGKCPRNLGGSGNFRRLSIHGGLRVLRFTAKDSRRSRWERVAIVGCLFFPSCGKRQESRETAGFELALFAELGLGNFGELWGTLGNFGELWGTLGNFGELWGTLGNFSPNVAGLGNFSPNVAGLGNFSQAWGTFRRLGEFFLQLFLKDLLIPYYIFSRNTVTAKTFVQQGKTGYSHFVKSCKKFNTIPPACEKFPKVLRFTIFGKSFTIRKIRVLRFTAVYEFYDSRQKIHGGRGGSGWLSWAVSFFHLAGNGKNRGKRLDLSLHFSLN